MRELDPEWRGPTSVTGGVEGEIAHREAVAHAAVQRYKEILRDAIPGTSPSWGVNRLQKELYDRGYILGGPTRDPGIVMINPNTNEEVRIMERPDRQPYRSESMQKFHNDYYYRYRPGQGKAEGSHITIPKR